MDLHGIAEEILGPPEEAREGEPKEGDIDVGFVTATEELMSAMRPATGEPKGTEVARKFLTLFQMAQDLQGD